MEPAFIHPRAARRERGLWAGVIALAMLLAVQCVVVDRAALAQSATWRPVVGATCAMLRCAVPAWSEPAAFKMLGHDVVARPSAPDVLQVSASFRNDARWAQAWPRLRLTLSDIDGHPVGRGVFSATDYLDDAPTASTLGPGQTAAIQLDVRDPSHKAVSFDFAFVPANAQAR